MLEMLDKCTERPLSQRFPTLFWKFSPVQEDKKERNIKDAQLGGVCVCENYIGREM